ncbi:MAG: OmpW/AlkL family protein [Pseudohongiellaceae bacterium]
MTRKTEETATDSKIVMNTSDTMCHHTSHLSPALAGLLAGCVFMSAGLVAHESGDTLLRLSPTLVQPNDSSSDLIADKLGNLTSALGTRTGVGVNSNTQAGITGVYKMDDHWGLELLAATPFRHGITARATNSLVVYSVGETKPLHPPLSACCFFPMPPRTPGSRLSV